jgi:hypothetical protein
MDKTGSQNAEAVWRGLYRAGGVAPLIVLVFYLSEMLIPAFGGVYPTTTEGWFELFGRSKPLGLFYLNSLDILSFALLAILFLALYIALRRTHESAAAIAGLFALIGIPVFIVPRAALLSVMTLSDQYAAAASEAERAQVLAAGRAIGSLGQATFQTTGFFFIAVAVLILSFVMLQGSVFGRATAYVGILASTLVFVDDLSLVLAPSLALPLMAAGGLLWIVWWILVGRRLLQLGRTGEGAAK